MSAFEMLSSNGPLFWQTLKSIPNLTISCTRNCFQALLALSKITFKILSSDSLAFFLGPVHPLWLMEHRSVCIATRQLPTALRMLGKCGPTKNIDPAWMIDLCSSAHPKNGQHRTGVDPPEWSVRLRHRRTPSFNRALPTLHLHQVAQRKRI